jgi:hypothetical protein
MDIQNKDLGKAIITVAENNVYDSQKTYERLTLVKHNGHVYLSKQDVPVNTSPTGELNDEYWLDYEVKAYSSIIGIAFTRAKDKPVAPTGGSYSNPHPVEGQWKPAPYDGEFVLWYSIRRFNENEDIQDPAWSEPSLGGYDLDTLVNILAERIGIIIE